MHAVGLLQNFQFDPFDQAPSGGFIQSVAGLVPVYLIMVAFVYLASAWYVYGAADRLARSGHGPALFPPFLWGLASLVAPLVVPLGFALLHYASWFEPEEDVPWSSRPSKSSGGGLMRSATEAHHRRVAELREDLAAARGSHRRRYIRSELRRLEGEGATGKPDAGEPGTDKAADSSARDGGAEGQSSGTAGVQDSEGSKE